MVILQDDEMCGIINNLRTLEIPSAEPKLHKADFGLVECK